MSYLITNEIFSDYLNCKYKVFLKFTGKTATKTEYEKLQKRLLQKYRQYVRKSLISKKYMNGGIIEKITLSDIVKQKFGFGFFIREKFKDLKVHFDALIKEDSSCTSYVPVSFIRKERVQINDKLNLAFCGAVIGERLNTIPQFGRIIYGNNISMVRVNFDVLIPKVTSIVMALRNLIASDNSPQMHLNKHCKICEFRAKCYRNAVENDDLSLLSGLNQKKIQKINNKGIFTVNQYSYTFKPRRRRKSRDKKITCYPELKALAIRENKIYVHGTPELPHSKVEIFLDIEGLPDKNFYYLIGLIINENGNFHDYSFWANSSNEEDNLFYQLQKELNKYRDYIIYHFGNYEKKYLKSMSKKLENSQSRKVKNIINRCYDLLPVFVSNIYIPTYSNGLKDIANFLGFSWTDKSGSGIQSIIWREKWELSRSNIIEDKLKQYNKDDCLALVNVKNFVSENRYRNE
ncbi:MAG: TM0106 family RecB-like putative nuclease [Desulfobacterales bacterium]|nr:MAG: TM0106 family RecB-like putative nuclease [Desulfobacterales bacterium]